MAPVSWRAERPRVSPLNREALDILRSGAKGPTFAPPRRSLLGEILDWMLAPLFLLWPMSVAITYVVAQNIADVPYDRALASHLRVLARQVHTVDGKTTLDMTPPVRSLLRTDETDSVFWLVLGGHGQYLGGDRELPLPKGADVAVPGAVRYEDSTLRGFGIRLAYTRVDPGAPAEAPALVIVAETTDRRARLANDIIKGVIIPQFVVLPIAVLLVWFGLSRGVAPLNALQQRLRARRPDDLSPIDERATPTEIAPLVAAINDLLERLSATVQTQRRFVADAAHQLKTPLAGLRTQAELALRDASADEMQASLRQLVTGSERATRLVNQLLLLARAENPATVGMAPTDLNALACEQTAQWAPHALAIGTDLGFEAAGGEVRIEANEILLAELLNNLIDNALRYTPRQGRVTVRVQGWADAAVLEVEDSGPGIPPAERERVFDRFYRMLGTPADGSGLGLAIVREIAQKHGAAVELSDNPGLGSPLPGLRITIRFPHKLHTDTQ
ncbi:histidine kinase [Bordetella flabilis]|uniref:histidine kinase n=2 Tax=Bordetella flabilis TaxID=463014 RepID=A0A193GG62_9BORD|nr:histidine kinase [Bordetella flabilis]